MPHKVKLPVDEKVRVVETYLSGKLSTSEISKRHNINKRTLKDWVRLYKVRGTAGLCEATHNRKSLEERIEIVSHCIANNKDYGKTIEQYGVSYQQIYGWVRKYERDGVDGLCDRRGKRKDEISMSENEKLRAQLKLQKAENLRLQMESDLLKKLEALERGIDED